MPDAPLNPESFAEHIRSRPGMFIGGTGDRALRHTLVDLILEILPFASLKDVRLVIESPLEATLFFAGDIPPKTADRLVAGSVPSMEYLNGLSIASAVCERLEITYTQDGSRFQRAVSSRGLPSPLEVVRARSSPGLFIRARFDPDIFAKDASLSFFALCGRVQEISVFNPLIAFAVDDPRRGLHRDYRYPEGLRSYIEEIAFDTFSLSKWAGKHPNGPDLYSFHVREGKESAEAYIYTGSASGPLVQTFANGLRTTDHGSHFDGLRRGFSDILKAVDPDLFKFRAEHGFDIFDDSVVLLAVNLLAPEYRGSTKSQLGGSRPEEMVYRMVTSQLPDQLQERMKSP